MEVAIELPVKNTGLMKRWERLTHSCKATILSNDGSRNGRDENGKLGAKNNLLQVEKHVSENGTRNLRDKSAIRPLAKRVGGFAVSSAAMSHFPGQHLGVAVLQ